MNPLCRILGRSIRAHRMDWRVLRRRTRAGAIDTDAARKVNVAAADIFRVLAYVLAPYQIRIEILRRRMPRLTMHGCEIEDPLRRLFRELCRDAPSYVQLHLSDAQTAKVNQIIKNTSQHHALIMLVSHSLPVDNALPFRRQARVVSGGTIVVPLPCGINPEIGKKMKEQLRKNWGES